MMDQMTGSTPRYDAIILGGGLAGLCLARQLTQERPDIRLLVLEKREHPVPEAAFKVGESTVEIAGHYFGQVLRLRQHMDECQLPKLGIRYFFDDGANRDLARRYEVGPVDFSFVGSYQIDRGRLENFLFADNRTRGIDVRDRARVREVTFGDPHHRVTFEERGVEYAAEARWVVDASGRGSLLKRKMGLQKPVGHLTNATWWRVSARVKLDDWSDERAWKSHVPNGCRWLSTNHLMGRGYWVWLIPLASDSTSFGIVADTHLHPYPTLSRLDKSLEWLRKHEPQCADVMDGYTDKVEDFLALNHYAHGCERVFSGDRWCMVGESGVFTDPFYSPGSDFIGIGNEMVCEMIQRDLDGEDIRADAESFNVLFLRLFEAYLKVYELQYPMMGNARVMTRKVAWDNGCYWGITALLFFHRKYRDIEYLRSLDAFMRRFFLLHTRMQRFLREWDERDQTPLGEGFLNILDIDFLGRLQRSLTLPLDDDTLRRQLHENLDLLDRFARALMAQSQQPVHAADPLVIPDEAALSSLAGASA